MATVTREMLDGVQGLMNAAKADWVKWDTKVSRNCDQFPNPDRYQMGYEIGSAYIHVWMTNWGQKSSHSWVVINPKNRCGFPVGTILKSASWKALQPISRAVTFS